MKLTGELIESFAGTFLSPRYDEKVPTPQFHRDAWNLYSSDAKQAMVIAPRNHAKSTALTMDYILAEALFRTSDYIILISSTEDLAAEQLSNISEELQENMELRREFGVDRFETESKADIIVRMLDGHRFRILCRGAEQRIRGRLWKGKRPNLLVCDDMEDDEQVMNPDRRIKFRQWFFRAAKQALGRSGKTRLHGTVLHDDSLLARLRKNKEWKSLFYTAHASFDDFSNILWPEQWSEEKLRAQQRELVEDGDSAGYSQEFLNNPLDNAEAFLRKSDFIPMSEEDHETPKTFYAGADFAVSKADRANRTSFTVAGKCAGNLLHFVDERVDRWSSPEWIDEMFSIQKRWNPEVFFVEGGQIWKAVSPMLYAEMTRRDCRINFEVLNPVSDKATRGRPYQKWMKSGGCRFDKRAEWYTSFEQENLRFTGNNAATLDDQFDSAAILVRGTENMPVPEEEDYYDEDREAIERGFRETRRAKSGGRNATTGY